jgi:hypothetical protein
VLGAQLRELVDEVIPEMAASDPVALAAPPVYDLAVVPSCGADAEVLLLLSDVEDLRWTVVAIDAMSGGQGVADVVARHGAPSISRNQWALHGATTSVLVSFGPRMSVVAELAAEQAGLLGHLEPAQPADETTVLPEAPTPGTAERVVANDLVARVRAVLAGDVGAAAPRPARPMRPPDRASATEEYPGTVSDGRDMAAFKDRHKGERLCLIGNGPSLNELDLNLPRDELTLGVNGIFYRTDELGIDLAYYVVEDSAVIDDNLERVRTYGAREQCFFPSLYRPQIGELDDTTSFMRWISQTFQRRSSSVLEAACP